MARTEKSGTRVPAGARGERAARGSDDGGEMASSLEPGLGPVGEGAAGVREEFVELRRRLERLGERIGVLERRLGVAGQPATETDRISEVELELLELRRRIEVLERDLRSRGAST